MGKQPHITIVGSRPTQQPRTKRMAKFNVAAQHQDSARLIDVYQGNTVGTYGLMVDSLYVGKIVINTQTGKVEDLGTASWQVNSWGTMASGSGRTKLFRAFDQVNDPGLIAMALGNAPADNHKTSLIRAITGTPEFKASIYKETAWGIRRFIDPNLGMWESGSKGAEMDIPTYRGQSIFVSAVALGRAFGLSKDDMVNGAMAKFNHRVGKSNGPRKAWDALRDADKLEAHKLAAWYDYHNRSDVLNKIEITPQSVATLADVIRRKLDNHPIRSLDQHIQDGRNEVFI